MLEQAFLCAGADVRLAQRLYRLVRALLAACRAHLADPDTVFTTVTVAQVWGTRPEPGGA